MSLATSHQFQFTSTDGLQIVCTRLSYLILSLRATQLAQLGRWFAWAKWLFALPGFDYPLERADMRGKTAGKGAVKREDQIEG